MIFFRDVVFILFAVSGFVFPTFFLSFVCVHIIETFGPWNNWINNKHYWCWIRCLMVEWVASRWRHVTECLQTKWMFKWCLLLPNGISFNRFFFFRGLLVSYYWISQNLNAQKNVSITGAIVFHINGSLLSGVF